MEPIKRYFKSEFQVEMCLLDHSDPSDFYLSCWQRNRQTLPLLIWRAFLFVSSLAIMLSSMITYMINSIFRFWFIYLTHWGLILIVLTTGFGTAISARTYFRGPIDSGLGLPWYIKVYWVLYNIAVPLALLITIFYWTVLYEAGVEEEVNHTLDVAVHGLNTLIVLLKLMTARHTSRILHFFHPLLLATIYMLFSVIYFAAGGNDKNGDPWIYSVINWAKPGPTTALVLVVGLLLVALHFLIVALVIVRDAGSKKVFHDDNITTYPEVVPLRNNNTEPRPQV